MRRIWIESRAGRRRLGGSLALPCAPSRPKRVRWLCAVVIAAVFVVPLHMQLDAAELPAGLDAAIDHGLLFLQRQQKEDGSFDAQGPAAAMAGLAVLAFLSNGHTPELGRYGPSAA